jgi:hypothetical protein
MDRSTSNSPGHFFMATFLRTALTKRFTRPLRDDRNVGWLSTYDKTRIGKETCGVAYRREGYDLHDVENEALMEQRATSCEVEN